MLQKMNKKAYEMGFAAGQKIRNTYLVVREFFKSLFAGATVKTITGVTCWVGGAGALIAATLISPIAALIGAGSFIALYGGTYLLFPARSDLEPVLVKT